MNNLIPETALFGSLEVLWCTEVTALVINEPLQIGYKHIYTVYKSVYHLIYIALHSEIYIQKGSRILLVNNVFHILDRQTKVQ